MLLLLACATPDSADPKDTATEAPAVATMPDHGGCTNVQSVETPLSSVVTETTYDDLERLLSTTVTSVSPDYTDTETSTWGEADCRTSWRHEMVSAVENWVLEYTATCDAHGNPTTRTGTYLEEAFSVTYTNTYEGDQLVHVEATSDSGGSISTLTVDLTWEGEHQIGEVVSSEGEVLWSETWEWEGDLLVLHGYDDAQTPANSYESTYAYDDAGRLIEEAGGGAAIRWAWFDEVYHPAVEERFLDEAGESNVHIEWTCGTEFPWACDGVADGLDFYEVDGEPDSTLRDAWSCEGG